VGVGHLQLLSSTTATCVSYELAARK
jgi:hypothetical protein